MKKTNNIEQDELFDRPAAAAYLKCSPKSMATWDSTGRYDFKPIKIGKKMVRYRKSVLDEFLRVRTRPEP